MKQTDLGLDLSTRRTRKQVLLDEMERVMPWNELLAIISPHAPVATTGRPPFELDQTTEFSDASIAHDVSAPIQI